MARAKNEYQLGFIINAALNSRFGKTFQAAQRQIQATKQAAQRAGKAWGDFGKSAGRMALAVGAAATGVVAAVWRMTDAVGEQGNRAYQTARRIGMCVEAYQELEYAFNQNGIEGKRFEYMMRRLDGTLTKAASSASSAARWGEEFGLSVEVLSRMNPEERIETLIEHLHRLEDPLERDRLALELFGQAGSEMARLLEGGEAGIISLREEARRTGNVMSAEAVANANAYANMKTQLRATISGIRVQLFSGLLPAFTGVMERIKERLQGVDFAAMGARLAEWVEGMIPRVIEFGQRVGEFVIKIRDGVLAVKDFMGGWGNMGRLVGVLILLPTAIKLITALVATFKLINTIVPIATLVTKGFNAALMANPIGLIIMLVAALVAGIILLVRNFDRVREVFINVWSGIKNFFSGVASWLMDRMSAIGEFFRNVWTGIKGFFVGIWEGIMDFFAPIGEFFSNIWNGIKNGADALWNGIVSGVRGMVNAVIRTVNTLVNGFLTPFNVIIQGLNRIPGVNIPQLSINIPQLAKGGIITSPMITSFAENAPRVPEAAIPIENTPRSRALWETTGRMAGFMSGGGGGGMSVSMPINITVAGNADSGTVAQLRNVADDLEKRIEAKLAKIAKQNARLSYA